MDFEAFQALRNRRKSKHDGYWETFINALVLNTPTLVLPRKEGQQPRGLASGIQTAARALGKQVQTATTDDGQVWVCYTGPYVKKEKTSKENDEVIGNIATVNTVNI